MSVQLNHTIVNVRDKGESATFLSGRGLYWEEPSGHLLEIITRPYGSGE